MKMQVHPPGIPRMSLKHQIQAAFRIYGTSGLHMEKPPASSQDISAQCNDLLQDVDRQDRFREEDVQELLSIKNLIHCMNCLLRPEFFEPSRMGERQRHDI